MGCDRFLRRTHAPRTSRFQCARTRVRTFILWWSHFAPARAPFLLKIKFRGHFYKKSLQKIWKIFLFKTHCFWNMIFLSFDFLHTQKKFYVCKKNKKKRKYDYSVTKSGKSIIFAWKVAKMYGRTCVVCDQLKNDRAHTLRTHVSKVISHAHVRPLIARVHARTHVCDVRSHVCFIL